MNASDLKPILSWLRTTDLVEISFREGDSGFSLSQPAAPAEIPGALDALSGRFTAVTSPAVGVFQWSAPGRAKPVEEGAEIKEGDVLGVIEQGQGAGVSVKAPAAGRAARIFVEGGAAVDYGRPLLFIERSA